MAIFLNWCLISKDLNCIYGDKEDYWPIGLLKIYQGKLTDWTTAKLSR